MIYCTSWKQLKVERIVAWFGFIAIAMWWLILAWLATGTSGIFAVAAPLFFILLALACVIMCVLKDIVDWRKYTADEKGITVLYCNRFRKFYPWNTFQEIIVCDTLHAGKNPGICHLVIRMAACNEEYGPLSKNRRYVRPHVDRWRGAWYTFVRFQKIICITFSPERLERIQQLSKLPVLYSLTIYGREAYEEKQKTGQWDG